MEFKRELNPALFGGRSALIPNEADASEFSSAAFSRAPRDNQGQLRPPFLPGEVKALEAQVQSLKNQLQTLERKVDQGLFHSSESAKALNQRFDRAHQQMVRVEESQSRAAQDNAQKQAFLLGKINERRLTETQFQEMLDRHNMIVRNFENRLAQLNKLLQDQEMQIHNSQAALDEARNEIARLKRL